MQKLKVFHSAKPDDDLDPVAVNNQLLEDMKIDGPMGTDVLLHKQMRVAQMNPEQSKCISTNLLIFLLERINTAALNLKRRDHQRAPKKILNLVHSTKNTGRNRTRACVLPRKDLQAFLCPTLSFSDLSLAKLEHFPDLHGSRLINFTKRTTSSDVHHYSEEPKTC